MFWTDIFSHSNKENFRHVEAEIQLACCCTLTGNKLTYSAALFIWTISTVIKLITLEVHGDTIFITASKLIFFTRSCFICKLTYKVIKRKDQCFTESKQIYWVYNSFKIFTKRYEKHGPIILYLKLLGLDEKFLKFLNLRKITLYLPYSK